MAALMIALAARWLRATATTSGVNSPLRIRLTETKPHGGELLQSRFGFQVVGSFY